MNVLRLHGRQDFRLSDEAKPEPCADESLVRVTAVGICGSDLHWFSDAGIGDARLSRPLVLGHEFSGVAETGDRRGDRVAVDPAVPCGVCAFCVEGNPNLCEALRFAGHGEEDGAFREYVPWPTRCLHALPDSLTDVDGVMLEPLGVAIHAVDLAHVKTGMTVGVFGCGPIGLLILQVAGQRPTQIIATDKLAHRLDAARALGATAVFDAIDGEESAAIWAYTGQRGADVAFEAAGENEAVETAVAVVRAGGRVILAGIPSDDRTTFSASIARRKGLTIKLVRRMKHAYPRAIRLVERGLVDVRSLVTHRFPLSEYEEAFTVALRRDGLKVIVGPRLLKVHEEVKWDSSRPSSASTLASGPCVACGCVAAGRSSSIHMLTASLTAADEDSTGPDWAPGSSDYLAVFSAVPTASEAGVEDRIWWAWALTLPRTMLPAGGRHAPLLLAEWRDNPHAWVKLWKHRRAAWANKLGATARELAMVSEPLRRKISSSGFPKVANPQWAPEVYAADRLIEGADWVVWQLTGVETRNSCTAGYKAIWSKREGFPPNEFFRALDPRLERVVDDKMSRTISPLGMKAGGLTESAGRLIRVRRSPPTWIPTSRFPATVTEPGRMVIIINSTPMVLGPGRLVQDVAW
jgi:L-iditol 2-dehydrogenase